MNNEKITTMIEKVSEAVCDDYCKWPEIYSKEYNNTDEGFTKLMEEKCNKCPIYNMILRRN